MAGMLEQGHVYGDIGGVGEASYRVFANRLVGLDVGGWKIKVRRRKPRGGEVESVEDAVRRSLLDNYPEARIESINAVPMEEAQGEEEPSSQEVLEQEEEGSPSQEVCDGEPPSNQSPKRLRLSAMPYSPSGTWGAYEIERTGTRHVRKRDETYEDLARRASAQGVELSTLRGQMGQIMAKLHTDGERTAAEVLAEVLMETLDKPDGGDADSSEAESSTGTAALPRESPRTRAGQELRELLIEVNRLTRQGKTKAANEKMDALEASAAAADAKKRHGNDLVNKRARDIRDVVFGTGQMVLTRRVVERGSWRCPRCGRCCPSISDARVKTRERRRCCSSALATFSPS